MAKLKFTIHPLFFLFGLYYGFNGKILIFAIYTLVAVIHEFGHASAAAKLGYKLNRVVLMPYGAVISGDMRGIKFRDEIYVALAGPLINLACAVSFVAMWWVFPETYAFTDTAMLASLSLAAVNMLPCYPLDGGRILKAWLSLSVGKKTANIVAKITGVAFSCVLGGLFIYTCFYSVNFSLLFFAFFALFGTLFTGRDKGYVKIYENAFLASLKRGAEVKRIAVSAETTVKKLLSLMDNGAMTEAVIFKEGGNPVKVLSPKEVFDVAAGDTLYMKMGDLIKEKGSRTSLS
ncbi:MAG: site-2 protease family protein [Clostridia bacterium]|nr:site-2 protease family protein [Clostridia bacterium]